MAKLHLDPETQAELNAVIEKRLQKERTRHAVVERISRGENMRLMLEIADLKFRLHESPGATIWRWLTSTIRRLTA